MKKRILACLLLCVMAITMVWHAGVMAKATDNGVIPNSYDLRKLNLVTSVKDQGKYETGWAFAIASAMESNALVRKYGTYDLSEYQLGYMLTHMRNGEGPRSDRNWYNEPYRMELSSLLLRGYAVQTEEEYPYSQVEKLLTNEGFSFDGAL